MLGGSIPLAFLVLFRPNILTGNKGLTVFGDVNFQNTVPLIRFQAFPPLNERCATLWPHSSRSTPPPSPHLSSMRYLAVVGFSTWVSICRCRVLPGRTDKDKRSEEKCRLQTWHWSQRENYSMNVIIWRLKTSVTAAFYLYIGEHSYPLILSQ